jgi:hypothetical protein
MTGRLTLIRPLNLIRRLTLIGGGSTVGTVSGILSAVAPATTSTSPASPAAFTSIASITAVIVGAFTAACLAGTRLAASHWRLAARRLIGTRSWLRTRPWLRTRRLGSLSTGSALRLGSAVGTTGCGIAAVLSAWSTVPARIARSVAPDIAVAVPVAAVPVATVAIAVPVAAAASSITIVARLAMRRPIALCLSR